MSEPLEDLIGNARVMFWMCPIREHSDRKRTVIVEWRGGVGHCTFDGCQLTSQPPTTATPNHKRRNIMTVSTSTPRTRRSKAERLALWCAVCEPDANVKVGGDHRTDQHDERLDV